MLRKRPPRLTTRRAQASPPLESLRQEATLAEHDLDSGVRKTVREAEQTALQPLPPPTTPAEDPIASPSAVLDQGVQQVTGEVQQKADVLKQGVDQVNGAVQNKADELKQGIEKSARKLENKANTTYERAQDRLQQELAPTKP